MEFPFKRFPESAGAKINDIRIFIKMNGNVVTDFALITTGAEFGEWEFFHREYQAGKWWEISKADVSFPSASN